MDLQNMNILFVILLKVDRQHQGKLNVEICVNLDSSIFDQFALLLVMSMQQEGVMKDKYTQGKNGIT